jgi:hypothetical protein
VSSGRRITIALVGLVLLVVIGYVVNDLTHHHSAAGPVGVLSLVTDPPSAPSSACASA